MMIRAWLILSQARASSLSWLSPELRALEAEQRTLASTLDSLPPAPAPQLADRLGYHSGHSPSADTVEWVEMDLRRAEARDAVVLVPAASDGSGALIPGYGFPVRFRVEISSSAEDAERTLIADHTRADFANPGALPVYLPCAGKRARFVRITATRLFRDGDRALFALGEVLLLKGARNVPSSSSLFSRMTTKSSAPSAPEPRATF